MAKGLKKRDGDLSAPSRSRLRKQKVVACKHPPGPKLFAEKNLSAEGLRSRAKRRNKVQKVVIGAGSGRCGTTNLAWNLQRTKMCRVTHERFDPKEIDYSLGAASGIVDKFSMKNWTQEKQQDHAKKIVLSLLDSAGGKKICGDISHCHSQIMEPFLQADPRVLLIVQTRDPSSYATSVLKVFPKPTLVETNLLQSRGISASKYLDRKQRLEVYQKSIMAEAQKLKKKYWPRQKNRSTQSAETQFGSIG